METGRPAQVRTAVYCRISRDEAGDQLGVKRQEKDCQALVHAKGWTVAEVFIDDDISAYKAKRRPGYEAMLEGVRAGSFDAIVCWKLDRLTRSGIRGLTRLLDALDGAGASLVSATETLDTSSAMGEGIAGLLASVAKSESEALSLRSRRKKDELAERGLPAGYSRSFGYVDNGMTVCEPEATELRRAAKLVLAGESLSSIARDWNTRGVLTPRRQKQWGVNVVRRVLINPRNAGLRVHRGEVVGPAAWDAIISIDTHRKLVALLTDPSRKLT
ncbi:MAG: recombinase family protein, partial [Acidimicrobiia bacterium]